MNLRKLVTVALLLLVGASILVFVARQTGMVSVDTVSPAASPDPPRHRIVAYYFHATVRCETCLQIERYTDETLKTYFADELADGRLVWQVINRETPPNEHFVQDYQLYSQALILVDSIPGQPAQWKSLEKIWEHAHDKSAFLDYVHVEVDQYLERL